MSGKKHTDALKKFDRDQLFTPTEAMTLVTQLASATFDEGVDVAVRNTEARGARHHRVKRSGHRLAGAVLLELRDERCSDRIVVPRPRLRRRGRRPAS